MQALHKHLGTEVRSLKAAIMQRDAKIQNVEEQLQLEHEEASKTIDSFNQQINMLKGKILNFPYSSFLKIGLGAFELSQNTLHQEV